MKRPGHWPTPIGLAILRVALLEGDPVVRGWRELAAQFDLDSLDEGSTRLVPLLERNLQRHQLENPWRDRMRGVYRYWWAHNQLLLRRLGALLSALDSAGVPTLVLKGAAVATRYYEDPALRPMNDADVLVPRSRVREALSVARRLHLEPEFRVNDQLVRLRHGVSLRDSGGNTIDLHWAIHEDDMRPDADDHAWRTAIPVEISGVSTLMLAPSPLLVHACAHGAKWAADPAVRWVADAALIIRKGDVAWDEVVREAKDRRFTVRTRSCLAYLRAALGAPVPDDVLDRLAAVPVSVFERIEHQVRVRRHDHLGELPRYWFAFQRSGKGGLNALQFASYLQYAWGLPTVRTVPAAAIRRAAGRLNGRRSPVARPRGPRDIPRALAGTTSRG
jgi:hypothetical protein